VSLFECKGSLFNALGSWFSLSRRVFSRTSVPGLLRCGLRVKAARMRAREEERSDDEALTSGTHCGTARL
jgi:hypothetical protein